MKKEKQVKNKILLFDIETMANLGFVWGKYEQNVLEYEKEWYMLCFAAKWLDKKGMIVSALPEFKDYNKDKENDLGVVTELWHLLDEADIVIAHNGDAFDVKKANARFVELGMKPPSPYNTVDTLKVARRYFKFNSNKLDDLGQHLGLGKKVDTGGWELWKGCRDGDPKAWKLMIKYCKQDVRLLEKVYLALRPWMTNHPNMGVILQDDRMCPICASNNIKKRGFARTRVARKQKWQCMSCGGWSQSNIKGEKALEIR